MAFEMLCQQCDAQFFVAQRYNRPDRNRFCSRQCAGAAGNVAGSLAAAQRWPGRFLSKLVPTGNECLEWPGRVNKDGYGLVKDGAGHRRTTHRVAYELAHSELPPLLRHTCDNRRCCNAAHMLPGTQADNVDDCIARGRFPVGEMQGNAKLTDDDVRAIRRDSRTQMKIAQSFGVSQSLVSGIKRMEKWIHVPS